MCVCVCLTDAFLMGLQRLILVGRPPKFVINGPVLREPKTPQLLQERHKDVHILLF